MHKYSLLDGLSALDYLELRLSPSAVAGSVVAHAAVSAAPSLPAQTAEDDDDGNGDGDGDDPLPNPEPEPGPDPGDDPPIVYPVLPPSGPSGPGS
jgi:hypothetical protein